MPGVINPAYGNNSSVTDQVGSFMSDFFGKGAAQSKLYAAQAALAAQKTEAARQEMMFRDSIATSGANANDKLAVGAAAAMGIADQFGYGNRIRAFNAIPTTNPQDAADNAFMGAGGVSGSTTGGAREAFANERAMEAQRQSGLMARQQATPYVTTGPDGQPIVQTQDIVTTAARNGQPMLAGEAAQYAHDFRKEGMKVQRDYDARMNIANTTPLAVQGGFSTPGEISRRIGPDGIAIGIQPLVTPDQVTGGAMQGFLRGQGAQSVPGGPMVQPAAFGTSAAAGGAVASGDPSNWPQWMQVRAGFMNAPTTPEVVKLQGQVSNLTQRLQTMAPNDPDRAGTMMQIKQLTDVIEKSGNLETEDMKLAAKEKANRKTELRVAGQIAAQAMQSFNVLEQLNNSGQLPEGPLGQLNQQMRSLFSSIGINVGGAAPGELAALVNAGEAFKNAAAVKPVSNTDLDFILRMLSSSTDTQPGRVLKLKYLKALQQQTLDMVNFLGDDPTPAREREWMNMVAQRSLFTNDPEFLKYMKQAPAGQAAPGAAGNLDAADAIVGLGRR